MRTGARDLDAVRRQLEGRRAHILDELHSPELPDVLRDLKERVELPRVDAALAACARGTYGQCEACGEAIDERRLAVRPDATRCADCVADPDGDAP
ncbi:TraR/DksA family transcriptional regulator [Candidatus Uhrbacteria bacterium]|nr:TraR/DksA family transcriptional regulator [Candidatus Uhrbacteria bacterium]